MGRPRTHHLRASSTFLDDLNESSQLTSKNISGIKDWGFAGICFLSAAGSLISFNMICDSINSGALAGGYVPPAGLDTATDLLILDLRGGYSAETVNHVLNAWGPLGCAKYLLIELIDVSFYHYGYRGLFVVLFNRMGEALDDKLGGEQGSWTSKLCLGPVLVAGSDFIEDLGQVAVVLSFLALTLGGSSISEAELPQWWVALVGVSSAVSVTKWTLCRIGLIAFSLGGLSLAGLTAKNYKIN